MKYRISAAVLLVMVAAFIQGSVFEYIEILSVRPNFFIVITVIIALLRGVYESAAMGLFFGLTMDIMMGKTLGWYALLLFLVSIPISMVNEKLYKEKFLVLFSFTFLSTLAVETLFYLIIFLFKDYSILHHIFARTILPEALYNSILILPLFKPISKVYTILDNVDRRRNRLSA
ncbi:MAG: rod shape-determining protein MreD [Clostridiaceae bacterium]|nr:rod shape-determining protein MreD [Clostridiaceae bacterium]